MYSMYERTLLSVDGYEAALKVLTKEKELEIIRMLEDEARKLLATGFKEPLELEIPIQISKRLLHFDSVFQFKNTSVKESIKGMSCFISQREAIAIRISHILIIGSIVDNDYLALVNTLKEAVVEYALHIMGEDVCKGSKEFETILKSLSINSSLDPFNNLTSYSIMDTYTCRNKHALCGIVPHSLKARFYYCPVCQELLDRVNIDFYKHYKKVL